MQSLFKNCCSALIGKMEPAVYDHQSQGAIIIPDEKIQMNDEIKPIYPTAYDGHFESLLITHSQIVCRTKQIAESISQTYYKNEIVEPIVLICILKGSSPFYNLLLNELSLISIPYIMEFVRVKSYVGNESSGNVKMYHVDMPSSIRGRHVIVVEDIVDTGMTLSAIMPKFEQCQPKSIVVCSLLVKRLVHDDRNGNQKPVEEKVVPKYVGFSIPDKFVVGFGLDYNEMYRDLRDIWIISQKGIELGGYRDS